MTMPWRFLVPLGACLCFFAPAANATLINFENLSDGVTVGSSYSAIGANFTNAVVLSAGISLDEAEFPPHSGTNVAADLSGPITIQFSSLVNAFSGYFTYAAPLLVTAFDSGSVPVRTAASLFSANFVSSGNPPNELIQINYASGIDHITIAGDPGGSSFVVDDISFTAGTTSGVPEPASYSPVGITLLALSAVVMRRSGSRLVKSV